MSALVRGYLEFGPYAENKLFGAPYGLNSGWASTVDDIHIWTLTLMGRVVNDPLSVLFLYRLLCFPLAALTMYWLCRRYGVVRPAAVLAGVLFSVLPGQQQQFGHLFIAAYWGVPFAIWLILETARGCSVLPTRGGWAAEPGGRSPLRAVSAVAALVVLGLGDIYFTALTVAVVVTIIVLRQFGRVDVPELGRLLMPTAVLLLPALASLVFARSRASSDIVSGEMAFQRTVADSDRWSGRLMDLILPWDGHRFRPFASLTDLYNVATGPRGEVVALGVVALGGLVGMLGGVMSRLLRREWHRLTPLSTAMGGALIVVLAFYTRGGLGSWVALFVTPQIRTWSRLGIFAAALGLLAVALALTAVAQRRGRGVTTGLAAALLFLGIWDQTNPGRAPDYRSLESRQADLAKFGEQVAAKLGRGCQIFNLPVVQFPEVDHPSVADNFALGVASRDLRWSFGAVKGTAHADWQLGLSRTDAVRLLDDLAATDFCGVVVHQSLAASAPQLAGAVASLLGEPVARVANDRYVAYDLRGRRTAMIQEDMDEATRRADRVLHPVVVSVAGTRDVAAGRRVRTALGPAPGFVISNMSSEYVHLRLSATVGIAEGPERDLRISGLGVSSADVRASKDAPARLSLDVLAPPGRSTVEILDLAPQVQLWSYENWEERPYLTTFDAAARNPDVNVGVPTSLR